MPTTIQIEPLKRAFRSIAALNDRELDDVFAKWAARYRSFVQKRFVANSRGGGGWAPLKRSTLLARARAAKRRAIAANVNETDAGKAQRRLSRAEGIARRARKQIDAGTYNAAILRDTGILFAALQPQFVGAPGQLQERLPNGIRVGIGGPSAHPDAGGKGGRVTIGDIAFFHDQGLGRNPRRQIIVEPDQATLDAMVRDLDTAIARMLK